MRLARQATRVRPTTPLSRAAACWRGSCPRPGPRGRPSPGARRGAAGRRARRGRPLPTRPTPSTSLRRSEPTRRRGQRAGPWARQRSVGRISTASISTRELRELLRSPYIDDELAEGLNAVIVPVEDGADVDLGEVDAMSLPLVIIGLTGRKHSASRNAELPPVFDVVLDDERDLERIVATIEANPIAATSLAVLLRGSERLPVEHALAAESAVYSLLQSGSEFQRWRAASRHTAPPPDAAPAVLATREGDELRIALNRPNRHNAF